MDEGKKAVGKQSADPAIEPPVLTEGEQLLATIRGVMDKVKALKATDNRRRALAKLVIAHDLLRDDPA